MDYIMETVGLKKSYKGNVVVNDVNIHVPNDFEMASSTACRATLSRVGRPAFSAW